MSVEPTLIRHNKGESVLLLQQLLNSKGASPQLVEDSLFGPLTEAALNAFKEEHKLTIPGVCGPVTWGVLSLDASMWY